MSAPRGQIAVALLIPPRFPPQLWPFWHQGRRARDRKLSGGLRITWSGMPVEAVCVWFAVSFTTVITYEVIKIWQALGKSALEAFFGFSKL